MKPAAPSDHPVSRNVYNSYFPPHCFLMCMRFQGDGAGLVGRTQPMKQQHRNSGDAEKQEPPGPLKSTCWHDTFSPLAGYAL